MITAILILSYTLAVSSLVWARFTFFEVRSRQTKLSALAYDPIVVAHISATYYYLVKMGAATEVSAIIGSAIYILALLLFWWAINTAKSLNFAFGNFNGQIITSGPFRFVRHPFYVSYFFIWLTSTLLFNSVILWITLLYLVAFYVSSAKSEEKAILSSRQACEYQAYCQQVNMFLPRIKTWKN